MTDAIKCPKNRNEETDESITCGGCPLEESCSNTADAESSFKESEIPESCPGVQSESAGKATPCQGCPNQRLCISGIPRMPDPTIAQIRESMKSVKRKILVLSGKGGVGKSTITAQLAQGLSSVNDGSHRICVLDIDICGPSIPTMFGLEGENIHQSASGWSPVYFRDNLSVISVGFLLSSPDQAVIWRGPRKNGLIKQFLREVDWSSESIDFLIIDTPPGTSDEHLSIVQYLAEAGIDGAIIVTTPQEVSLNDVRKEISFCNKVGIKIIGVVENMSSFTCESCHCQFDIFPPTTGGAKSMCVELNIPHLASIPLHPQIGLFSDEGKSFFFDTNEESYNSNEEDAKKDSAEVMTVNSTTTPNKSIVNSYDILINNILTYFEREKKDFNEKNDR